MRAAARPKLLALVVSERHYGGMIGDGIPVEARDSRRTSLLVLALYFFGALIYLWPLPLHLASYIPGDNGDSYPNFWPFWYFPRVLMGNGSLFYHQFQLYPHGLPLVYVTASPVGGLLMSPISMLVSVAAALNTWLLLHLWLGGWFFYKFCRLLGCGAGGSWLGGFAWQWSPFIAAHITGHYTLVQVGFTAAAFYFLMLLVHRVMSLEADGGEPDAPGAGGLRRSFRATAGPVVGLGLACWGVAVTDFYLTIMTAFLLPLLLVHIALDGRIRRALGRISFWGAVGVAVAISGVLAMPWGLALLRARWAHDYTPPDPELVANILMQWRRLASPPQYHFLWSEMIYGKTELVVSVYNEYTYLGAVGFIVAAVGLLYVRPVSKAVLWIAAFVLILGLGSGNTYSDSGAPVTGILTIGRLWPGVFPFGEFRVPGRWHFALCAVVAIALALGANALLNSRLRTVAARRGFLFVVTALMALDLTRYPLPICPASPVDVGLLPDDAGTVLDVPLGIQSGQGHQMGVIDHETLRRQIAHERPVLYASPGRLSNDVYDALMSDAELQAFFEIQRPSPDGVSTMSQALDWPAFRERYDITAAIIPDDWATSAALRQVIDMTAPGRWEWRHTNGTIVGEMRP